MNVSSALVGQIVVFAVFAIIIYALVREAARVVIKVMLVAGILLAVAIVAGWLDDSMVGHLLEQVGDALIVGIKAVVGWVMKAWSAVSNSPSGGRTV
ncbi:MAG TPA: hypothetical protein VFO95_14765 [Gemmatimonadales bacterium]|nr:hypothetical protein [Gemmatimonadales bacterium]